MKKKENIEEKKDKSEKLNKKININEEVYNFSSQKNKLFNLDDINDNESNSILYSDIKLDYTNIRENIKRTTIMPCLPSKDINQNILKFINIKIKSIKEEDINLWKAILYNHNRAFSITQLNENKYNNDDNKIFNNQNHFNEFNEMDIIRKDTIRTRNLESKLIDDYIKNLETLLRFFVKKNKLLYKQGLNEIAGAFLLLKYSNVKKNMTFSEVYNLLNGFFHLFVINYYHDKTIYSIKNSLSLLQILIKYHAPDLFNFFEKSMLFPEVYATSWILTVFAYKLNLNKLFYLWNKLIVENDQLMIHFFMASLLIYKKNSLLNLDEYSLPMAMNRININSEKEIDLIFNNALNLRKQTPYSFRIFAYKLDILKHRSNNHKLKFDYYHPDTLVSIPIFPSEICFICYKNDIKCPDENHISVKNFNCEHCSMGIKKDINYLLVDLRLGDLKNNKSGILQNVTILDQKELNEENSLNKLIEKFNSHKDINHFIFINSKSGNIIDSDSNLKSENLQPKRSNSAKNGIVIEKVKKKKLSQNEKNLAKEEDLLKKLILTLRENNYKYISYAYGGFEEIHNEILDNINNAYSQIKILNHVDEKCDICKKRYKKPKNLSKSINQSSKSSDIFKNSIKNQNQINNIEININDEKYKSLTIDEVNKMISNTNYFAGPCSFTLEKKKGKENVEIRGLLIIFEKKLFCIKVPIHNNKQMLIIHEIFLIKIKEYKIKNKLHCHIHYINNKDKQDTIVIKFNAELDSEKFLDSLKKAKSES